MNTPVIPVDVPEEVERQLQTLRFKQLGIKRLPLDLARARVVDEEALGNAVAAEAARAVLGERLRAHREYDELGKEIAAMEERLQAAQQRVRIENATQADERLAAAQAEYRQASITCARSFRRFIDAVRRSSNVPGASSARVDLRLNLPALMPLSWGGGSTTGEAMNMGHLPFEQGE